MGRTLYVRRREFVATRRKPVWKIRRGGKIITARARKMHWTVGPTAFRIRDRGRPGRGPRRIRHLDKGEMTEWAIRLGYINEGQRVSDIPYNKIDDFAIDLARMVGPAHALRMFNVQVVFRKRQRNGFKRKMKRAVRAIQRVYFSGR